MRRLLLFLLFLLSLPGLSHSAEYFVDKDGVQGAGCNDSWGGTINSPRCSIQAGRGLLTQAGDILTIRGGHYNENIKITRENNIPSGTGWGVGQATVIQGKSGELVTIAGGDGIQVIWGYGNYWYPENQYPIRYVIFRNFRVTNDGGIGGSGCNFASDGTVNMGCGPHFIRFEKIEISGKGCSPGVGGGFGASHFEYIDITVQPGGCTELDHGFYILMPYALVERAQVYGWTGSGIQVYDSGCPSPDGVYRNCGVGTIIRNSYFRGNGTSGVYGGVTLNHGSNMQFYNNIVAFDHVTGVAVNYGAMNNTQIYNNTIYQNPGQALQIAANATNTQVKNNIITSTQGLIRDDNGGSTYAQNLCAGSNPYCTWQNEPPQLQNPNNGEFQLTTNSPHRNAGVTGLAPFDYAYASRPQGSGWDIGAYEYTEGGGPPPTCGAYETGTPPNCTPQCPSPHPSCPVLPVCPPDCPPQSVVKAFPTAEGLGAADTTGGRGGTVIEITTLADAIPAPAGSFRACAEGNTPRICVFRVGGTIALVGRIYVHSDVTIAGQTAPGEGVTIRYFPIYIANGAHNIIIRHLRHRQAYPTEPSDGNNNCGGFFVYGDGGLNVHHVILDHVSAGWECDDSTQAVGFASNITYQWSLVGEPYECRWNGTNCQIDPYGGSKGFIVQTNDPSIVGQTSVAFHHSVIANTVSRSPASGPFGLTDFRYNLIYNWNGCESNVHFGGRDSSSTLVLQNNVNFVGNVYLPGPDTQTDYTGAGCVLGVLGDDSALQIYVQDNETPYCGGSACAANAWNIGFKDFHSGAYPPIETKYRVGTPFNAPSIVATPRAQMEATLKPKVGATIPKRDGLDTRLMAELTSRTGGMGRAGAPESEILVATCNGVSTTPPCTAAPTDTDHDGMPDAWESAHGTNPSVADGHLMTTFGGNGYTNVENYLNELAGDQVPSGTPCVPPNCPVAGPTGNPIYVQASGGSPANDCIAAENQQTPKQTLGDALRCMTIPGKRMIVRGGTYVDTIKTSTVPITGGNGPSFVDATTIEAFPGESVTIQPDTPGTPVLQFNNGANDKFIVVKGSPTAPLVIDANFQAGSTGIQVEAGAHHLRFEWVDVKNSGYEGVYGSGASDIQWVDSTVHHAGYAGVVFDGTNTNWVLERTIVRDNHDHGLLQNSGSLAGLTIKESTFKGNGSVGAQIVTSTGAVVKNTLLINNGGHGLWLRTGVSGASIVNSTLAMNTGDGFRCDPGVSGTDIRNSIIFGNVAGNLVNNCAATVATNMCPTCVISGNPLFVSTTPGSEDYHLADGSPGINAGTATPSNPVDLDGNVRPDLGGTIDIGCFERGQTPVDPGGNVTVLQRVLRWAGFFF
jgi:hypothetical protein